MKKIDVIHLLIGSALAASGVLSLYLDWGLYVSVAILILLCVYILALLLECAYHSRRSDGDVSNRFFELPNREWALLLVALFVVTNVFTFANIYIQTESIEYKLSDCCCGKTDDRMNSCIETMANTMDAVYFSIVTVTTLGYGEFTPKSSGRVFVVWHLASGLLLLLVLIPVAAARVSDW